MNNSFVDPGAFVCPEESTFGRSCFETPFQFSGHKTVYTIGPFIGYRWQLGNWVVGLEGDWSWKNAETSLSQSSSVRIVDNFGDASLRTDQFSGSIKQKSDYSIRGRVGTLVTPWSLGVRNGWRRVQRNQRVVRVQGQLCEGLASSPCTPSLATATATTAFTWNDTRTGYTVGAGWESELFRGWKWRAEYRWTDFGNYTKTFGLATQCTGSRALPSSCTSSPSSSVSINLKESFTLSVSVWPSTCNREPAFSPRHGRARPGCQRAAESPQFWACKIPHFGGVGDQPLDVIGASIFGGPAAALGWRRYGRWLDQGLGSDVLRARDRRAGEGGSSNPRSG